VKDASLVHLVFAKNVTVVFQVEWQSVQMIYMVIGSDAVMVVIVLMIHLAHAAS